jgi:hypothetical protein
MVPTQPRGTQGEGPHDRLVIRGATVIDGTGAQPRGPMDIVVEGTASPRSPASAFPRSPSTGSGVRRRARARSTAPGITSCLASSTCTSTAVADRPTIPDYVYKLWMMHGVTTVRGVPCGGMDWDLAQRELSAKNQIVAPRIFAYHRRSLVRAGIATSRRTPRPRASGCAGPPRRASTG